MAAGEVHDLRKSYGELGVADGIPFTGDDMNPSIADRRRDPLPRRKSAMQFLTDPPRFLFFTGKGGVGKTSVACATAVQLASAGEQVLLVSTDPASNVGQVFGVPIGNVITPIPEVPGLSALEIDPAQAVEAYRERVIAPVLHSLSGTELAAALEGLAGSCTTEIASFDEFTTLLTDDSGFSAYDHIVFDTAPTGHTIRLLRLPGSWTAFLESGADEPSCLGPLSGLDKHTSAYARAVEVLADPFLTRLVLVTRAQDSALRDADRTFAELNDIGISSAYLVVNGMLPDSDGAEPLALALREHEADALRRMPPVIAALHQDRLQLKCGDMVGVPAIRSLFEPGDGTTETTPADAGQMVADAPLSALVDELEQDQRGLVLCMGKGGVGKTTVAAVLAIALARRGHHVHLTTTDPAGRLAETLRNDVPGLEVARIDPAEAIRQYREHVMETRGRSLDSAARAALIEDLQSPCNDEVAVFQQFSKAVALSRRQFVIIDTAPTGHTLLLLDTTGAYHREVTRQYREGAAFTTPLMRLQDPAQTKVILVTLAETTPVLEALELQDDLGRASIRPWAWVVNNSIAAARPRSAFLRQRAANELPHLERVRSQADRFALIPLLSEEPVGETGLVTCLGGTPPRAQ